MVSWCEDFTGVCLYVCSIIWMTVYDRSCYHCRSYSRYYGESYHGTLLHHVCPHDIMMEAVKEGQAIIITGHTQGYVVSVILEHSYIIFVTIIKVYMEYILICSVMDMS